MLKSYLLRAAQMLAIVTVIFLGVQAHANWSPAHQLYAAPELEVLSDVKVAADETGRLVLAWRQADGVAIVTTADGVSVSDVPTILPAGKDNISDGFFHIAVTYAGESTFICAWTFSYNTPTDGIKGIAFVSRSIDGGMTWSAPDQLFPVPFSASEIALAASADSGTVLLAYGEFLLRSEDRGTNWATYPVPSIPLNDGETLGWEIGSYELFFAGGNKWFLSQNELFLPPGSEGSSSISNISVSYDDGFTWQSVWKKTDNYIIDVRDLTIAGNDVVAIVEAAGYTHVLHSADGGLTWPSDSFGTVVSAETDYGQIARAQNDWVICGIGTPSRRLAATTVNDLADWGHTPFPLLTYLTEHSVGERFSILELPNGDVLLVFAGSHEPGGYGIWSTRFSSQPEAVSQSYLGFLPVTNSLAVKTHRLGATFATGKFKVANFGDADSVESVVRLYYSQDDKFDRDDEPIITKIAKHQVAPFSCFVKPIKAAKTGKAPKKRSINAKISLPESAGYIIAEVLSATEPADGNNVVIIPYQAQQR